MEDAVWGAPGLQQTSRTAIRHRSWRFALPSFLFYRGLGESVPDVHLVYCILRVSRLENEETRGPAG